MQVVVVGAGPSGLCVSIFLAKLGYQVDVYDKRSSLQELLDTTNKRGAPMVINGRGLWAMQEAGVRTPTCPELPELAGSFVRDPADGKVKLMLSSELGRPQSAWVGERAHHMAHLLGEAQRMYPSQIRVHWGHSLGTIDFERRVVQFEDGQRGAVHAQYDLLVGADGRYSKVRDQLQLVVPGLTTTLVRDNSDIVWKRVTLRGWDTSEGPGAAAAARNRHGHGSGHGDAERIAASTEAGVRWVLSGGGPGRVMVYMTGTNRDSQAVLGSEALLLLWSFSSGTVNGVLVCRREDMDRFATEVQWRALLDDQWPELPPAMLDALAKELPAAAITQFTDIVRCSSLVGPACVLLGDAAHAMSPSIGTGVNAALEDAALLYKALQQQQGDIPGALASYNARRCSEAHFLTSLEHMSTVFRFGDSRTKLRNWRGLALLAHLLSGSLAHAAAPRLFGLPAWQSYIMTGDRQRMPFNKLYYRILLDAAAAAGFISLTLGAGLWLLARPWLTAATVAGA